MTIIERLKQWFSGTEIVPNGGTIDIDIPETVYMMQLAVYCATSLIGNAISQCEVKCYENGRKTQDENYYSLNVKPNPNESAPQFWAKVIRKMLTAPEGRGALCIVTEKGELYCADSYSIREKQPFRGNLYDGIIIDGFQLDKVYKAQDVLIFRQEDPAAYSLIASMYNDLGEVISAAMAAYKDTNFQKYVFHVNGNKAGDENFASEFETYIKKPIERFVKGDAQVYVEYEGYGLKKMEGAQQKGASDMKELLDMLFTMCGKAYKIPTSLMNGNVNDMKTVVSEFLTFAVDPIADMIGKTLTAQYYTGEEYAGGNYFKMDTSRIQHLSPVDMAANIDKLIASAFYSVDEVRKVFDEDPIGEDWAEKHYMTKNYTSADMAEKGGLDETTAKDDDDGQAGSGDGLQTFFV
ncbi:phage portal protein [Hornefia butyriciproducens]|uniref:phage portal protein n=1 Tax=Hornefia butyriciproducens TaxID=2652293 RepID=UPI003F8C8F8D